MSRDSVHGDQTNVAGESESNSTESPDRKKQQRGEKKRVIFNS